MKSASFLHSLIALLMRREPFPVRVWASREAFPQGDGPHCHNGFELRLVQEDASERIERLDLIHPEVCHCNMLPGEWRRAWILLLRSGEMRVSHGTVQAATFQSPELAGFLEFLAESTGPFPEERLLEFRLRLALTVLHGRSMDEAHSGGRMARMAEHLRNHYYNHALSIAELARQAGCSPNYVQTLFRQETGMTPAAYLRKVRMEAAARFLREGRHLVKEIALLCGFADAHFFAMAFRRYYGCPPSEFAAREAHPASSDGK